MRELVLVGAGGLLGAISRFGVSRWLMAAHSVPSHFATLAINTVGSFLLGYCVARAGGSGQFARWQAFLTIGFCGSFTTFSSWILDLGRLARDSSLRSATHHMLASLALGVLAVGLGVLLGRH